MNSRAMVRCIHFPSLSTSVQFADRTRCARTRTHTHTNTLRTLILSLARLPPPSAPSPVFRDRQAGSSGPASLLSCHSHRAHAHARSHAAPCHAVPCFTMLCFALPCTRSHTSHGSHASIASHCPVILSRRSHPITKSVCQTSHRAPPKSRKDITQHGATSCPANLIRPLDLRTMLLGSYMGSNSRMINCRD